MDNNQLITFITVAKHLNFSKAGRELYISQPTVSHQISSLEKELGTRLFNREATGISLTESGKLFLDDAKGILDIAENAIERLHYAEKNQEFSLSIAYLLAPCHSFLPTLIANFQEQYPQVNLTIHRMNAKEISQAMLAQQYDLFFSITQDLDNHSKYSHKTLFKDTMSMVFPNFHSCAKSGEIDFGRLASEPFLALNPDVAPYISRQVLRFLHSKKCFPSTVYQLDTMEDILFEVEAGLGFTILPTRNQLFYHFPLTYIPIEGIYSTIDLGIAWMDNSENPAVPWFLGSSPLTNNLSKKSLRYPQEKFT